MSTVTTREKSMLLIAVVLVLYAVAALSYKTQLANWKREERIYKTAQKKLADERALIAARADWAERYTQMSDLMPVFPYEQDVATYWLNLMERASNESGLMIARRQTGKESEVGDVFELPIECRDWEGTLESLVKFLYEVQRVGAMLDVRQLYVRPTNNPGYLKGTFTLYCAYMRGESAWMMRDTTLAPSQVIDSDESSDTILPVDAVTATPIDDAPPKPDAGAPEQEIEQKREQTNPADESP